MQLQTVHAKPPSIHVDCGECSRLGQDFRAAVATLITACDGLSAAAGKNGPGSFAEHLAECKAAKAECERIWREMEGHQPHHEAHNGNPRPYMITSDR